LRELEAEQVFYPDLSLEALLKGHACHFRCQRKDLKGLRVDVIGVMRGVDDFHELWKRRKEVEAPETGRIVVIGLSDLVKSNKTQRDRDWPMIRRVIEADIHTNYVMQPPFRGQKQNQVLRAWILYLFLHR